MASRPMTADQHWRGRMEERLDQLIEDFREHREATENRGKEMLEGINKLTSSVTTLTTEVGTMKPDVADYRERRAEHRGMGRLAHWIWIPIATFGAAVLALWSGKGAAPLH